MLRSILNRAMSSGRGGAMGGGRRPAGGMGGGRPVGGAAGGSAKDQAIGRGVRKLLGRR